MITGSVAARRPTANQKSSRPNSKPLLLGRQQRPEPDGHRQGLGLAAPEQRHRHRRLGREGGDGLGERLRVMHGLAIKLHDEVIRLEPGLSSGAVGDDAGDEDAGGDRLKLPGRCRAAKLLRSGRAGLGLRARGWWQRGGRGSFGG